MIQASTLKFLKELKKNNNKPWFDTHRKEYELAKKNMEQFCAALIIQIGKFDKDIALLSPKDCLFRINRDVRFSKDKSPYKTNMGAYLVKGGKKSYLPGYYFHIEPGKSMMAGGLWMPEADKLKAVRQEIDYNLKDFKKIIADKKFKALFPKLEGEKLVNPPKGYDALNPALEFLKHKSWVVTHAFGDKEIMDSKFVTSAVKASATMKPFLQFFHYALAD